jgi:hypothetical protein
MDGFHHVGHHRPAIEDAQRVDRFLAARIVLEGRGVDVAVGPVRNGRRHVGELRVILQVELELGTAGSDDERDFVADKCAELGFRGIVDGQLPGADLPADPFGRVADHLLRGERDSRLEDREGQQGERKGQHRELDCGRAAAVAAKAAELAENALASFMSSCRHVFPTGRNARNLCAND